MFTITIKQEDVSKRSGTIVAAKQRRAGKHQDKRRKSANQRRNWKREEW